MALFTFLDFATWNGFSDTPDGGATVDYQRQLDDELFPLPVWFDRAGLELVETFGGEDFVSDLYGVTFQNPASKITVEISVDLTEGTLRTFVVGRDRSFTLQEYLVAQNRSHEFERDFCSKGVATYVTNLCCMIGGEWADIIKGERPAPLPRDGARRNEVIG